MAATANKDCQRKAHFTFIWAIENASALVVSENIVSPSIVIQSLDRTKWRLYLPFFFQNDNVALALKRTEHSGPDSIEIEFELSILSSDGSPLKMVTSKKKFKRDTRFCFTLAKTSDEVFVQRKAQFLPNDTLTVRCRMWRTGTVTLKTETCFARSRLRIDRRCFVWAIRECSSLQMGQKRQYFVNQTSHGSPQLILSLFLSESNNKNYVNIQIDQNYASKDAFLLCKISILDIDGRVVHFSENRTVIYENSQDIETLENFFEKDKIITDAHSLLQNDILTLRCEFLIEAGTEWNRIENYRYLNIEELEQAKTEIDGHDDCFIAVCPFKKTLADLYEDKSLSDVNIRSGATLLPAHKNVLSARSPVFKAMFTQDMKEKFSKVVDIPDFDADTLRRLLLYIYKDTVKDLQWETAMYLYRAADKYQLLDLRKKCSFFLKSSFSVTNVCNILSLANMHEDGNLQKAAEYFISEHDNEVFKSDAWKEFKMGNVRLALEIAERIILNR